MSSITDTYPATARVWVYMADRVLSDSEAKKLEDEALVFVKQWAAHGKDLNAHAELKYNRFLILMVDEERNMASGCSIDASVHFVQQAGKSLQVDFFNRMLLAYKDEQGEIKTTPLSAIDSLVASGAINGSTTVFNNLVNDRKGLDKDWEIPASSSPYKRWL